MYVVIGQSPTVDVSQVIGPFKTYGRAREASEALDAKGYVTEIAELMRLTDIDNSPAWDYAGDSFVR